MRKENFINIRGQLEVYAKILDKYKTPVRWQKVMSSRDCDEVFTLADGHMLYATIEIKPATKGWYSLREHTLAVEAHYNDIYKIDSRSGNILWKYGREGLMGSTLYEILLISDTDLIIRHITEKVNEIIKIDLATGKEMQKVKLHADALCTPLPLSGLLLTTIYTQGALSWKSFSADDLKEAYSGSLSGVASDHKIKIAGDNLLMIMDGPKYHLMDIETGQMAFTSPVNNSPYEEMYIRDEGFILVDKSGKISGHTSNGNTLWQQSYDYLPYLCTEWEEKMYWIKHLRSHNQTSLACADNAGKMLWEVALDDKMISNFCFGKDVLSLSTAYILYFFDTASGKLLKKTELEQEKKSEVHHITYTEGNWTLKTETGISCYGPEFGVKWSYELSPHVKTLAEYLYEVDWRKASGNMGEETTRKYGVGNSTYFAQSSNDTKERLQKEYEQLQKDYKEGLTGGQVYRGRVAANAAMVEGTQKMDAAFAVVAFHGAMNQLGQEMGRKLGEKYVRAEKDRVVAAYGMAQREATKTTQEGYFIKRFETTRSINLLIVELSSGKWTEVILGPREGKGLEYGALLKTCLYSYNPAERTIYCYGIGLDPGKWEEQHFHQTTTVKSSWLAFRTDDMTFRNPEEYPEFTLAK